MTYSPAFSSRGPSSSHRPRNKHYRHSRQQESFAMQYEPKPAEFDIEEARRVLGEAFAPWGQDLGLSIVELDCVPPEPVPPDWQGGGGLPRGVFRSPVPPRGLVVGRAALW